MFFMTIKLKLSAAQLLPLSFANLITTYIANGDTRQFLCISPRRLPTGFAKPLLVPINFPSQSRSCLLLSSTMLPGVEMTVAVVGSPLLYNSYGPSSSSPVPYSPLRRPVTWSGEARWTMPWRLNHLCRLPAEHSDLENELC